MIAPVAIDWYLLRQRGAATDPEAAVRAAAEVQEVRTKVTVANACPHCGEVIAAGLDACPQCGTRIY